MKRSALGGRISLGSTPFAKRPKLSPVAAARRLLFKNIDLTSDADVWARMTLIREGVPSWHTFSSHFPPVVLLSQLYSLSDDRSTIDKSIEQLRDEGRLVMVRLERDEYGLMRREEYVQFVRSRELSVPGNSAVQRFLSSVSSPPSSVPQVVSSFSPEAVSSLVTVDTKPSGRGKLVGKLSKKSEPSTLGNIVSSSSKSSTLPFSTVMEPPSESSSNSVHHSNLAHSGSTRQTASTDSLLFSRSSSPTVSELNHLEDMRPSFEVSYSKRTLRKSGIITTESDITDLVHAGILQTRDVADSWWLAIPSAWKFLRAIKDGRSALMAFLRRRKFNEAPLKDVIAMRGAFGMGKGSTAALGTVYFVLDAIGHERVRCVETTTGIIIRIRE